MHLEAVTICWDHADILDETLTHLIAACDDLVVVTSPDDQRTRRLVARTKARCVATDEIFDTAGAFHLGLAINAGMRVLRRDDWVLSIDA